MTPPHIEVLQKVHFGKYAIELQKDRDGEMLQIQLNGHNLLSIYDSMNKGTTCVSFDTIEGKLPCNSKMDKIAIVWVDTPKPKR